MLRCYECDSALVGTHCPACNPEMWWLQPTLWRRIRGAIRALWTR